MLAVSAGAEICAVVTGTRAQPDSATYAGAGKVTEIREAVEAVSADIVLVNYALSPSQERNLEKAIGVRVLDRTGLILDIFAQRAQSHEGKLQVQLAQLEHLSTRLVRGWTHLERQKGGIGLRGPGETQLESDRRMVAERIRTVHRRLDKVRGQRTERRRARQRSVVPSVSLVGYTNAGKSSVFNALTGAHVYAADRLFATLDPTMRRVVLPGGAAMILADTVGFIRHLPHGLVAAFRSTLEEVQFADLLLHVVDEASDERRDHIDQVRQVLDEIGAAQVPTLLVMNKIDSAGESPRMDRGEDGLPSRVYVSARTGAGMDALAQAIAQRLAPLRVRAVVRLALDAGRLRAQLYATGAVLSEAIDGDQLVVTLEVDRDKCRWLAHEQGLSAVFPATGNFLDGASPSA